MRKRDIILFAAAVAVALLLGLHIVSAETLETASWGLSYPVPGQIPKGPADAKTLSAYGAAYVGDGTEQVLYLTFDAGYENGCTAKILDVLKAHQAPAAFFLVGNYLEKNADLVRRMVAEGHTVGNHTMHHPDMSKLEVEEEFKKELEDLEKLYEQVTGEKMEKYYRPPQGNYSQKNLEMAQKMGYHTVFWSLAYVDWNNNAQPTADYAFSKLLPRTHNGAVVLLHSTSQTNAAILDELLTRWEEMGYTFAPISDLFA